IAKCASHECSARPAGFSLCKSQVRRVIVASCTNYSAGPAVQLQCAPGYTRAPMTTDHPSLETLLERNRSWADLITRSDPDFFARLAQQQAPRYLWIGCSYSRVPANQILGLLPGEIFVHRNVANVVVHSDLNCLSVIQFAVDVLLVKHIIVCGHYGCGGVAAAMQHKEFGLIDNWLRHLKDIYHSHEDTLESVIDEKERLNQFCEFNVIEQAFNVC